MITNHRAGYRAFHLVFAVGVVLALTACVADEGPTSTGTRLSAGASQPRLATYSCDDDGTITVEARASAVRLVDTEGASYDLPASPPTQNSRFGENGVALVVEGGEALWMKAGRQPLTCRR